MDFWLCWGSALLTHVVQRSAGQKCQFPWKHKMGVRGYPNWDWRTHRNDINQGLMKVAFGDRRQEKSQLWKLHTKAHTLEVDSKFSFSSICQETLSYTSHLSRRHAWFRRPHVFNHPALSFNSLETHFLATNLQSILKQGEPWRLTRNIRTISPLYGTLLWLWRPLPKTSTAQSAIQDRKTRQC